METLSSFILALLAFGAAALGYLRWHSIILTVLLFLVVVMIGRTIQPMFLNAWKAFRKKHFPLPELLEFYVENMPEDRVLSDVPGGSGMRVLAMTEALRMNSKTRPLYRDMAEASLLALAQESPLFALRLETVRRRGFPVQYVSALCDKDGKKMRKCVRIWFTDKLQRNMKAKAVNKELFVHDGEIDVPGRDGPVRYTVLVLFDGSLPCTLPGDGGDAAREEAPRS